jgi:hypothetical protein
MTLVVRSATRSLKDTMRQSSAALANASAH